MKKIISLALLAALTVGHANSPIVEITREFKASTIDAFSRRFEATYIFPDVAKQATADLKKRLAAGEYDAIAEGPAFASALNKHLQAICKDAHLHVRFSTNPLPKPAAGRGPTPEEIEFDRLERRFFNNAFHEVKRLPGNIGYIKFNLFHEARHIEQTVRAAYDFVANTDALIFDIRDNGGGDPEAVQLICSYLFDKKVHLNTLRFREGDKFVDTEFWTKPVPGSKYTDRPVHVLVSKRTGSAAEEFSYNLQNLKRATILGESTWGGANPGSVERINDHISAFIPNGMAINPYTKTNWEGTGVTPDIKVAPIDALYHSQRLLLEDLILGAKIPEQKALLERALNQLKQEREKSPSK